MTTMLRQSWNILMNTLVNTAFGLVCSYAPISSQAHAERYFEDSIKGHRGRSQGDLTFV